MLNHQISHPGSAGSQHIQFPQHARAVRVLNPQQFTETPRALPGSRSDLQLVPGSSRQPSRTELFQTLVAQGPDDLEWILDQLARRRQDVKVTVHRTRHEVSKRDVDLQLPQDDLNGGMTRQTSTESNGRSGVPTIQFSSTEFHVRDEEEFVDVEIIRTGNKEGRSEVTLLTKDHTAKAGENYVAMEDKVVFEPGVGSVVHQVELTGVTHWEALLDFNVSLQKDTIIGAKLGRQLSSCRVKIICNDTFPNVDLDDDLEEDPEFESHHTKLKFYWAFLHMLWSDKNIRKGTIKRCLEDQLHNVNFIVLQFIMVFSVNEIFHPHKDDKMEESVRVNFLYGIIGIMVLCLGVLHIMDYMRLTWPVGGPSRKMIQKALLRRFMYYDSEARRTINPSDLVMAVSRDAIGLCSGYSAAMKVVQALGGLLAIFIFKISSPFVFGKSGSIHWEGFSPFLVFPIVLAIFMRCRSDYTTECLEKKEEAANDMVTFCSRAVECFPLVSDYKRRQRYVDGLDDPIGAWNGANKAYNKANLHNTYFPQWLVLMFVCLWYAWYGRLVIYEELSLGFFLADIKIIEKFGKEFGKLYVLCMKIETTFPDLCRITTLLNKPTDLEERLVNEKDVLRRTRMLRKQMASAGEGALDRVPIFVRDLRFRIGIPFNFRGSVEIAQGSMACFVGAHGAGKSTLLKVLGNAIFPQIDAGEVFIPAHVRSLHVSLEPYFFEGTLMENMCFGVENPSDGAKPRVQAILKALHCEDCVDDGVESTEKKMWQSQLTVKERHTLNLARALIANPYLLCIHKPTMAYGAKNSDAVMTILKDFVANRGIEQGSNPVESRRPRTVIYTSFRKASTEYADKIFKISQSEVCLITYDEVSEDMF